MRRFARDELITIGLVAVLAGLVFAYSTTIHNDGFIHYVTLTGNFIEGNLYNPYTIIPEQEYGFHIPPGDETPSAFYWFYFKATGVTNKQVKFVLNLTEHPGWGWFWIKSPVYSYTNQFCEGWQHMPMSWVSGTGASGSNYLMNYTTTWQGPVWLASSYPFPKDQYEQWLSSISTNQYVHVESLGHDEKGSDVWLATITDTTIPAASKKNIWIISGTHTCETEPEVMLKMTTDWLLTNNATAISYRQRYIFNIVYMVNPDYNMVGGQIHSDPEGHNLNRYWSASKIVNAPEILAIYNRMVVDEHANGIDLFVDWHDDGTSYDYFYRLNGTILPNIDAQSTKLSNIIHAATGATIHTSSPDATLSYGRLGRDNVVSILIEFGLYDTESLQDIFAKGPRYFAAFDTYFTTP